MDVSRGRANAVVSETRESPRGGREEISSLSLQSPASSSSPAKHVDFHQQFFELKSRRVPSFAKLTASARSREEETKREGVRPGSSPHATGTVAVGSSHQQSAKHNYRRASSGSQKGFGGGKAAKAPFTVPFVSSFFTTGGRRAQRDVDDGSTAEAFYNRQNTLSEREKGIAKEMEKPRSGIGLIKPRPKSVSPNVVKRINIPEDEVTIDSHMSLTPTRRRDLSEETATTHTNSSSSHLYNSNGERVLLTLVHDGVSREGENVGLTVEVVPMKEPKKGVFGKGDDNKNRTVVISSRLLEMVKRDVPSASASFSSSSFPSGSDGKKALEEALRERKLMERERLRWEQEDAENGKAVSSTRRAEYHRDKEELERQRLAKELDELHEEFKIKSSQSSWHSERGRAAHNRSGGGGGDGTPFSPVARGSSPRPIGMEDTRSTTDTQSGVRRGTFGDDRAHADQHSGEEAFVGGGGLRLRPDDETLIHYSGHSSDQNDNYFRNQQLTSDTVRDYADAECRERSPAMSEDPFTVVVKRGVVTRAHQEDADDGEGKRGHSFRVMGTTSRGAQEDYIVGGKESLAAHSPAPSASSDRTAEYAKHVVKSTRASIQATSTAVEQEREYYRRGKVLLEDEGKQTTYEEGVGRSLDSTNDRKVGDIVAAGSHPKQVQCYELWLKLRSEEERVRTFLRARLGVGEIHPAKDTRGREEQGKESDLYAIPRKMIDFCDYLTDLAAEYSVGADALPSLPLPLPSSCAPALSVTPQTSRSNSPMSVAHIDYDDRRDGGAPRNDKRGRISHHPLSLFPASSLPVSFLSLATEVASRVEMLTRGKIGASWLKGNDEDWFVLATRSSSSSSSQTDGGVLLPEIRRLKLRCCALQRLSFAFHSTGRYTDSANVLEACIADAEVLVDLLASQSQSPPQRRAASLNKRYPAVDELPLPNINHLLLNLLSSSTKEASIATNIPNPNRKGDDNDKEGGRRQIVRGGGSNSVYLALRIAPSVAYTCLKRLVALKSESTVHTVMIGETTNPESREAYFIERRAVAGQMLAARLYLIDSLIQLVHCATYLSPSPPLRFSSSSESGESKIGGARYYDHSAKGGTRTGSSYTSRSSAVPAFPLGYLPSSVGASGGGLPHAKEAESERVGRGKHSHHSSTPILDAATFFSICGAPFSFLRSVRLGGGGDRGHAAFFTQKEEESSRLSIIRWRYIAAQLTLLLASTQRLGSEELGEDYPLHARTLKVIGGWSRWLASSPLALTEGESLLPNERSERWRVQVVAARKYLAFMGLRGEASMTKYSLLSGPQNPQHQRSSSSTNDSDEEKSNERNSLYAAVARAAKQSVVARLSNRYPHSFGLALLAAVTLRPPSLSQLTVGHSHYRQHHNHHLHKAEHHERQPHLSARQSHMAPDASTAFPKRSLPATAYVRDERPDDDEEIEVFEVNAAGEAEERSIRMTPRAAATTSVDSNSIRRSAENTASIRGNATGKQKSPAPTSSYGSLRRVEVYERDTDEAANEGGEGATSLHQESRPHNINVHYVLLQERLSESATYREYSNPKAVRMYHYGLHDDVPELEVGEQFSRANNLHHPEVKDVKANGAPMPPNPNIGLPWGRHRRASNGQHQHQHQSQLVQGHEEVEVVVDSAEEVESDDDDPHLASTMAPPQPIPSTEEDEGIVNTANIHTTNEAKERCAKEEFNKLFRSRSVPSASASSFAPSSAPPELGTCQSLLCSKRDATSSLAGGLHEEVRKGAKGVIRDHGNNNNNLTRKPPSLEPKTFFSLSSSPSLPQNDGRGGRDNNNNDNGGSSVARQVGGDKGNARQTHGEIMHEHEESLEGKGEEPPRRHCPAPPSSLLSVVGDSVVGERSRSPQSSQAQGHRSPHPHEIKLTNETADAEAVRHHSRERHVLSYLGAIGVGAFGPARVEKYLSNSSCSPPRSTASFFTHATNSSAAVISCEKEKEVILGERAEESKVHHHQEEVLLHNGDTHSDLKSNGRAGRSIITFNEKSDGNVTNNNSNALCTQQSLFTSSPPPKRRSIFDPRGTQAIPPSSSVSSAQSITNTASSSLAMQRTETYERRAAEEGRSSARTAHEQQLHTHHVSGAVDSGTNNNDAREGVKEGNRSAVAAANPPDEAQSVKSVSSPSPTAPSPANVHVQQQGPPPSPTRILFYSANSNSKSNEPPTSSRAGVTIAAAQRRSTLLAHTFTRAQSEELNEDMRQERPLQRVQIELNDNETLPLHRTAYSKTTNTATSSASLVQAETTDANQRNDVKRAGGSSDSHELTAPISETDGMHLGARVLRAAPKRGDGAKDGENPARRDVTSQEADHHTSSTNLAMNNFFTTATTVTTSTTVSTKAVVAVANSTAEEGSPTTLAKAEADSPTPSSSFPSNVMSSVIQHSKVTTTSTAPPMRKGNALVALPPPPSLSTVELSRRRPHRNTDVSGLGGPPPINVGSATFDSLALSPLHAPHYANKKKKSYERMKDGEDIVENGEERDGDDNDDEGSSLMLPRRKRPAAPAPEVPGGGVRGAVNTPSSFASRNGDQSGEVDDSGEWY